VDGASDGLRADAYLSRELAFLSRGRVRQKIQMGESLLNGRRYSTATRLRSGDRITIAWRGPPDLRQATPVPVLFEDDFLLALDKPAGMVSHPVGRTRAGTLVQFARERCARDIRASLDRGDMSFYPTLVNRLDAGTSGIVLVAKTRDTHRAMQALTVSRQVAKEYIALVEGRMSQADGRIELPLVLPGISQIEMIGCGTRIQNDGTLDVLDGRAVLALLVSDHTQQVECVRMVRFSREDLPVDLLGC